MNAEADVFASLDEAIGLSSSESEDDDSKEQNAKKHKRLLDDISAITGVPRKREALRSEPATHIDEHLWSQKGQNEKVLLNDLLDSVPNTTKLGSLKKKIEKLEKSKSVLDAPLSKPEKQKIQRNIAYTENQQEISKWEPTVLKNRQAENLSFPLNAYKPPQATTKLAAVNFKPRSSLEKEIAAVLKGSSSVLERRNKPLTESEEKALQAVDLEEAKARRKELQKLRVLQSYYEAKCKRLKKIKSKKFRKIHRKSEQKKREKEGTGETEEGTSDVSEKVERNRVLERAHLRHRNTSKWAKKLMTKSNKSVEEKQLLHDQLNVSRQLTEQKTYEVESDEESAPNPAEELALLKKTSEEDENPWLLGGQESEDLGQVVAAQNGKTSDESSGESSSDGESEVGEKSDEEWRMAGDNLLHSGSESGPKQSRNKKAAENLELKRDSDSDSEEDTARPGRKVRSTNVADEWRSKGKHADSGAVETDNGNFVAVESKALDVNVFITDNSEVDFTKSAEQRSKVREAFACDAVMEEFENEKKKEAEKRAPKEVDLTLPGWGNWGGAAMDNEKILRRKRKMFVKKEKKRRPARAEGMKYVILNDEKNKFFTANQVSALPFPFKDRSHFERSMRHPLGKTWNTPSVSAKLTQPRISTLIGNIIDPIKKSKEISNTNIKDANSADFIPKKKRVR